MRRVRRGLEHDGVAGHERRHHLPARDRHREVPGRDDPGHTERLADAHRPLVGQLRRDRVAGHPPALAGHQVGDVDAFLDVAARLGDDLAHLAGHRPGEVAPCARPSARRTRTGSRHASGAGVRRHIGQAVSAALMAIATSAAVPCWNRPTTSRVSAGLRLSNVAPDVDSHHSPAMKWRKVGVVSLVVGHLRIVLAGGSRRVARG